MDKLISVIITCYNSEDYLPRAIESVLSQSYKNIEIVVVNDGSNGDFDSIIKKYRNNKRIKFILLKENRGLFYARIAGLKHSNGEYVAFLDADDSVSFDFYRTLLKTAVDKQADIAIGDTALRYSEIDKRYLNFDPIFISDIELKDEDVFNFFMDQRGLCFTYYVVWNKLYKSSLIAECLPTFDAFAQEAGHITMCEDIAFSNLLWLKAKKVVNVHNIFYYYSQHGDQETKRDLTFEEFEHKLVQIEKVFRFFEGNIKRAFTEEKHLLAFSEWKKLYGRIWSGKIKGTNLEEELIPVLKSKLNLKEIEEPDAADHSMVSTSSPINLNFDHYENLKKLIHSSNIEYISFDVFDTLLLRPLFHPEDVFRLMTQDVNRILGTESYIDFHSLRTLAEKECRKQLTTKYGIEDVNIDEIYQYISQKYSIPLEKIEKIKNLELEIESNLLQPRQLGKDFYECAQSAGKKIICISDMYLSEEFIRRQLGKNGYGAPEKIFVSSEQRVLKGTGNLYKEVLRQLNIKNPNKILHLGDNWITDIIMPKKNGMLSGLIPHNVERLCGNNPGTYSGNLLKNISEKASHLFNMSSGLNNFIGIRVMLGLVANRLFDRFVLPFQPESDLNGNPYFIGYFTLGMHLYALCEWLKKHANPDGTIHFIARDGYLLKKAMEIYAPEIKTNYLYFSRKAIVPFIIGTEVDMLALTTFIRWQVITPMQIWELFRQVSRYDRDEFVRISVKIKFPHYKTFASDSQFIEFLKIFYNEFLDHDKLKEARGKLRGFLDSLISEKDLLFDLGYSGRNEELFSRLLGRKIRSAYIHTNTDVAARRLELANAEITTFYDTTPTLFVLLRESLFSELGPSCIAYDLTKDPIAPVFEPYERKFHVDFYVEAIHAGALQFVKDFSKVAKLFNGNLFYRPQDASIPYEYFLHFAKRADRDLFRSWIFEDDLYGGVRLNIADYWAKLQKETNHEVSEKTKKINNSFDASEGERGEEELEMIKKKYALLEKELDKLKSADNRKNALNRAVIEELDKRWIILNLLYSSLKEKPAISLSELLKMKSAEVMQKIPFPAPADFDENTYCTRYPDVAEMVRQRKIPSAYFHYIVYGIEEGRNR